MALLPLRPKEPAAAAAPTTAQVGETSTTNTIPRHIRIKNRRKRYLDLHPEYFYRIELELAYPNFYNKNVRRYLTRKEREQNAHVRDIVDVLEASLMRSLVKADGHLHRDQPAAAAADDDDDDDAMDGVEREGNLDDDDDGGGDSGDGDDGGEDLDSEGRLRPMGKDVGWTRWVDFMQQRFLRGEDGDFDYGLVDGNDEFDDDDEEDRERFERWLEDESNEFLCEGPPKGETGVQDY